MSWREFFYFQKSDRHVLMVLLGIAIVFMSLVYFLGSDEMEENAATFEAIIENKKNQQAIEALP